MTVCVSICLKLQDCPAWLYLSPAAGMGFRTRVAKVLYLYFCFFCSTCRPLMCETWLSALRRVMYLIIFQLIRRWDVCSSVQRWSTRNLTCRHRMVMPISLISWTTDTGTLNECWELINEITLLWPTRYHNVNVDVRPKTWGPKPSQSCPAGELQDTSAVPHVCR